MNLNSARIQSPVGIIEISGSEAGIRSILFMDNEIEETPVPAFLQECVTQLNEYFDGKRKQFNLKLDPRGTAFQLKVWKKLQEIPFGRTISYLDLARMTGRETNTRAVGNANGKNQINIVVPCHRVIGSNGKLTGYGGGLWRKEILLKLEMGDTMPGLFAGT
ncbi:MAG: methylated-DNA--[protein]-cysteine S-methyltransferase [Bacteroidales bacterium]|nr:methylated-DNA--[protein]-cysteine S-methyltransferase [Bacteroidales bacterium]